MSNDAATCSILGDIYTANAANWQVNLRTGWQSAATGTPADYCSFYGTGCDASGVLTLLDLRSEEFSSSVPVTLGNLTGLTDLWFHGNKFVGSIPSSFGRLTALTQLMFFDCQLSGTIPSALGSLTRLKYLYLSSNQLNGTIPSTFSSLTSLAILCVCSLLPLALYLVRLHAPSANPGSSILTNSAVAFLIGSEA